MRYDNWDVILFPKDSHVPIQEFKTACYNVQNAGKCFFTLHSHGEIVSWTSRILY
jgi:hypothetical protein